jgi:hypothetical protein
MVMRHSKQAITSDNAGLLVMLMGLVPNSPTTVEIDRPAVREGHSRSACFA